ncbi:MAG TPA: rod shape-determining protein MreC [Patescibacteria group bacterium]|nr:rod shape-determining protein MreC [Patescibacteria group bacterium]
MKPSATGRKRFRRGIVLVTMILLAIFFSFQGLLTTVMGPIAAPLTSFGTWISEKAFWWREGQTISAQALADLYEDRLQLAINAQAFEELEEENDLLRQELNFVERSGMNYLSAQVLAKSVSHSVSRFIIDVGSGEGAKLGAAVVSGEGIYVGKIIELGEHSATVSALTDPTHSIAVSLLNKSRTIGVATGSVGDLLQIDFIPTDEAIAENDLVVTSGLESFIPSGLLVGVVNTVQQETGSPFQQAIVEPLTDIRRLSVVLVLTSSQTQP